MFDPMTQSRHSCLGALALLLGLAPVAPAAELVPRGVYYWAEDHEGFGGFSGLAMSPDGASLMTVSDAGWLVRARLSRDAGGRLRGIVTEWRDRFLDSRGDPVNHFKADAEALAVAVDGTVYVAFESYTRIDALHPPDMTPKTQHRWDRFRALWGNAGLEALAVKPEGGLLAILEEPAEGHFRTLLGDNRDWRDGPAIPASDGFGAADAAFGPDGRLYLLERRFAYTAGYATRIRRFAYEAGRFGAGETLIETPHGALDNMEGISLWRDAAGQTVISLISDDNFLPIQNTLLVEYDLVE
jgi:hypothetical protein